MIDWVICGGETGPKARPMNPDWVRSLRDQCQVAGIPFFFKSWGKWQNDSISRKTFSKFQIDGISYRQFPISKSSNQ
jgi:protein gp37